MKRVATARIQRPLCGNSTSRNCLRNQPTENSALLVGGSLAGANFLPAPRAFVGLQNFLTQPDRLRRNLHEFIVGNKFNRLLETQLAVWNQADRFVGAG